MNPEYRIRKAKPEDRATIVAFTVREAQDAEGTEKDRASVTRGVQAGFDDPLLASYWVAETQSGQVVASTSVITEWSNFHGAYYWWIQSLFILPAHRGSGLVDLLLEHLANEAQAAGALDLRLYAHSANQRALQAYRRCNFDVAPYTMMIRRLTHDGQEGNQEA